MRTGIKPKKRLGQNFLIDENIAKGIVDKSGITDADIAIEIGPGEGILTKFLAESASRVLAVEIDKTLCENLSERLAAFHNVEIIQKDFLKINIKEIARKYKRKVKIIGNLPFYITTPIITKCLQEKDDIESLIFGVQKEVGQRLLAKPGKKEYGSIACYVNYFARIGIIGKINKGAFWPRPAVDAVVLKMDIRDEPAVSVKNEKLFFKLIRASFNQRRKTLLNSLQRAGIKKDKLELVLKKVGVEHTRRGETLSLQEFADIANALVDILV